MPLSKTILGVLLGSAALGQSWMPQDSGVTASLRGIGVVSQTAAWASGSHGTFLRTTDGGASWQSGQVAGAADSDFRAVRAIDDQNAFLLSIGAGEKSRIYKTTNAGGRWLLLLANPDPKGFFDAMAFWDPAHGIVLGDPVDGRFTILTTADGGDTWKRQKGPQALANEGAFAASNSCLVVRGAREAWFATGGSARVFHTTDGGETWSVAKTPMRSVTESAGVFSIAFSDSKHGVAVGGDYKKTTDTTGNVAITTDGGKTWTAPSGPVPAGFRSAIAYIRDRKMWIATGTSGSDVSFDDGSSWKQFDTGNYNAVDFLATGDGWAVGPKGAIARFKP